ncbi:ETC complex I subunit [Rhodoligotrophos ferricapiens]|uniref:ETC complex I subunit n=1 Tax=Rhodoligotrophos ferricapiens TaxID=3069264 RepID=UPI00315D4376
MTRVTAAWPSNDNRRAPTAMGRSWFPEDAIARIYKPSRSVMTSGKARTMGWRLTFERRTAPFIEPLMGWTGGDDTLTQVELSFPTREAAIRYAERQGLRYTVQSHNGAADSKRRAAGSARAFSDATLNKLGLKDLQKSYGRAIDGAADRNDPSGPETWGSPLDVVRDRTLSLGAKRSILINWAFTEYLIDQATNEGMPENNRPSRLDEVEQALLALEREVAEDQRASTARKAA